MINNQKVLAIIPARGGSKRLPRKNILPFIGKPLIAWSIEATKKSQWIDEVLVSTDDDEIAQTAEQFGAWVPELRPTELSSDTATSQSVLKYTLERFGKGYDIVILLQPTSPLRQVKHIDEALTLFFKKNAHSIVSVTPCEHNPLWANTLPPNGSMQDFIQTSSHIRSQDLNAFFRLNGAIYIYKTQSILQGNGLTYTSDTYAYQMENIYSIDIDNKIDFEMAEFFAEKLTTID
ncbi:N-acylneuraminate cytidylyltransferase [Shewanella sp. P1-14-1]|uniref:acylneuraminate cytidylyltransferase family protein n=1 Tax=Shewanella TaxID=22 RepID=UPI0006D6845F|nr:MULTISPECIES: acylneuraminate cytidylyltransferase family protein [Shewanella]KPZ69389.1 N-acylneuraminate cytidylyltransferase [Shewanella sp. P1-14-1]